MANLIENLSPPFYVAIIKDKDFPMEINNEITPTDKMVSIAPHQLGFLGLEATRDKQGKSVTISYWSDINFERSWEQKGDKQIREHFDGIVLKDTCTIHTSKITHKIKSSKKLYTDNRTIPQIVFPSSIRALITASFTVILQILRQRAVH